MLLRLLAASKIDGAPSQPALHKLTKKTPPPSFLYDTPEGWRVETDDPAWSAYIARATCRRLPQTAKFTHHSVQTEGTPDYTPEDAEAAAIEKLIQQARNERIKAESALIDLEAKRGAYIEREKMLYLLSFFQQGITNGFEHIKKQYKDDKSLAILCDEMERNMQSMYEVIEKELGNV
jgi:hypothetical protein